MKIRPDFKRVIGKEILQRRERQHKESQPSHETMAGEGRTASAVASSGFFLMEADHKKASRRLKLWLAKAEREGLLRDPKWGNLEPKMKSLPSLRAGGLLNLNGDFKRA